MKPTRELVSEIYAEKIRRAREATVEERLAAGPMLFEMGCEASRAGIRSQNPGASPARVEELLLERLNHAERLEERAWTQTPQ